VTAARRLIALAWFPHAVSSLDTYARYLGVAAALEGCFDDNAFGMALVRSGHFKPRTREPVETYLRRYATADSGDQPWRTMARMTTRFFRLLGWMEQCEEGGSRLTQEGRDAAALDPRSDEARNLWVSALLDVKLETPE
jgi:hypothetical protein